MPRIKESHSGTARGQVTQEKLKTIIRLDHNEALSLVRHITEALTYGNEVQIEAHSGRRTGPNQTYRISIRST